MSWSYVQERKGQSDHRALRSGENWWIGFVRHLSAHGSGGPYQGNHSSNVPIFALARRSRSRICSMEFTMGFRSAVQRIRAVLSPSPSTYWFDRGIGRPFLLKNELAQRELLRIRMRVLRRDRHRCRGCDKKEDGIALHVSTIRLEVAQESTMLSLCTSCQKLAKDQMLSGEDIPDFLRHLWHYLHHAEGSRTTRVRRRV
jgi:hypothetical protein